MKKSKTVALGGRPVKLKGAAAGKSAVKGTLSVTASNPPFDKIKHLASGTPLQPPAW